MKKRHLKNLVLPVLIVIASLGVIVWVALDIREKAQKMQRFAAYCEENGGRVLGRGCMLTRGPTYNVLHRETPDVRELEAYLQSLDAPDVQP